MNGKSGTIQTSARKAVEVKLARLSEAAIGNTMLVADVTAVT